MGAVLVFAFSMTAAVEIEGTKVKVLDVPLQRSLVLECLLVA